jgi:hypothetical protein
MVLAPPPGYPFGHVRLIASVDVRKDEVEFDTIEATSEGGPPQADPSQSQTLSIGPVQRTWRFAEGQLSRWNDDELTWQVSSEAPRLARFSSSAPRPPG